MDKKTRNSIAAALNKAADSLDPPKRKPIQSYFSGRPLDPRSAMVYFDIHIEDYNMEEDEQSDDPDAQERLQDFLKLGNGDPSRAASKAESLFIKEMAKRMSRYGLRPRLSDEGHGSHDALVMKFGVDSLDDVEKLIKFVGREMGGGDDIIYSDDVPYMEARGFTLYPGGVNDERIEFDDMEDWLEDQKTVSGSAKVSGGSTLQKVERIMRKMRHQGIDQDRGRTVVVTVGQDEREANKVEDRLKEAFGYDEEYIDVDPDMPEIWGTLDPKDGTYKIHVQGSATVSAASLKTREEKALFKYIHDMGKGRQDYEENNSDSVPDHLVAEMRQDIAEQMVGNQTYYRVGPYGHGFVPFLKTPASKRFIELADRAAEEGYESDFEEKVAEMLRYDVDVEKPQDVNKRNQVVVFHWENQDLIEDQLDERELEELASAVEAIGEDALKRVVDALDREDIRWEPESRYSRSKYNDLIYIAPEGNGWDFVLDLDVLEGELEEIIGDEEF